MTKDELYQWLCEMNDHELTQSEKSYIDSKIEIIDIQLRNLNKRLDTIVRQISTWSK